MSFKLYDSAGFTVTDLGYGVLIRANVAAVETFLQGNDADDLRIELDSFADTWDENPTELQRATDNYLSDHFTDFGAEARQAIGERE